MIAHLRGHACLACSLGQGAGFPDSVGEGLLAKDVFPSLDGLHRRVEMHVIRG